MTILSKPKSHENVDEYFRDWQFYNKSIKKPKTKCLKNTNLLAELPFYNDLSTIKTDSPFKNFAKSFKVEIAERKDPIMQFEASKEKIKDLMKDLLYEDKSFRYQITLKVLLKNDKSNVEIEFRPVYFNTSIKTVTRQKFYLSESLQEVLYLVDNWINEGSGLVIEDINRFFVNVSLYQPLYGSSYVNLPVE